MPDTCSAVGCKNRRRQRKRGGGETEAGQELHFYRIPWGRTPQRMEKRRLWMQAICRKKLPEHARICSAHFISGAASDDPEDPDYVPSLFSYNTQSRQLPQAHVMDKCCVPNCCNDSRYNQTQNLSFHPFPKNPKLKNRWVQKVKEKFGKDLQVTTDTRICSRHFRKSDFITDEEGTKLVKPQVLPSKFQVARSYPIKAEQGGDPTDNGLTEGRVQDRTSPIIPKQEQLPEQESDKMLRRNPPCNIWSTDEKSLDVQGRLHLANEKINDLEMQCKTLLGTLFFLERFSSNSECIKFYTGFVDYQTLKAVYMALEPLGKTNSLRWMEVQRYCQLNLGASDLRVSLPLIDQFFMFLCYVRRGFCEQDLAVRFNLSVKSVTYVLLVWINYLFISLRKFQIWPSWKAVDATMPVCFRRTYPSTRVILNCTEVKVQMPGVEIPGHESSDITLTFKGLLGISPNGAVAFVSDLYDRCASDWQIAKASRILNLIVDPSTALAPESFLLSDVPSTHQSPIIVPPFWTRQGETYPSDELTELKEHVEGALAHVKDYHVFRTIIPRSLAESANELWMVCALLANFKTSLCP